MRISRLSLTPILLLLPATALAGDHENHMQAVDPIEEGDLRIDFSDMHCQEEFILVKAEITNDSSDYVVVRKEASVFEFDGKEKQPFDGKTKKPLIIKPRSSKKNTYKIKSDGGYHVEEFELALKGFYTASADGDSIAAPEFKLPASQNTFDAGPFECNLKGLKQETKETVASFSCKYNGESIGFIDSAALGVRIEAGQEFANVDRKASKKLMEPGQTYGFKAVFKIEPKIVDMQFATMFVIWRDTFSESALDEIELESIEFELDEALTLEKND